MHDKEHCDGNWKAKKGIFLILIAALIWFNNVYNWFNNAQLVAVILGIIGLKLLVLSRRSK